MIGPDTPIQGETSVAAGPVAVRAWDGGANLIISFRQVQPGSNFVAEPAEEPRLPADVRGNDELYLIGVHLEQYKHATRSPEPYWRKAIRRDLGDWRSNHALGLRRLRRGEFERAETFFREAIDRLTASNANSHDCEAFYSLGVTLRYLGRTPEAYDAFCKATWDYAWRSPAYLAIAEIDASLQSFAKSLEHVRLCLRTNADHVIARNLGVMVLRRLGHPDEA